MVADMYTALWWCGVNGEDPEGSVGVECNAVPKMEVVVSQLLQIASLPFVGVSTQAHRKARLSPLQTCHFRRSVLEQFLTLISAQVAVQTYVVTATR